MSIDLAAFERQFEAFILEQEIHDAAHDINHIKRVVKTAKQLAQSEQADMAVVLPAAWLHDCVTFPKNHPDNKRSSVLAADKAIAYLESIAYPETYLEDIHHAICAHSYSAKIEANTTAAKVVQDADRLDGLGAIGVARCMLVAGKLGSKIYHHQDPFCETREADSKVAAVDHFYEKLFKTAKTMQTEAGLVEAQSRVDFMKLYLARLEQEMGL